METLKKLTEIDATFLAFGGLVFFVVIALVNAIRYFVGSRVNVVEERMRRAIGREAGIRQRPVEIERPGSGDSVLGKAFRSVGNIAKPMDEESMGRLRARLTHAGFRGDKAVFNYLSAKIFLAAAFLGVVLWFNARRPQPLDHLALFIIVSLFIGFYSPGIWLRNRIAERKAQINRALPDALDLMVTCVESGLGLDAAINRVGNEVSLSAPLLSQELLQSAFEIQAGSNRGDAFRRMADRTGVEEIRNLSALIVQAEKFGTSVSKTLRVMAEGMRVRRMQLAEERAATASVKMTLPLIFCIFPTLLIIILGPAIVKFMDFFANGPGN